ncbi:MAG: 4-hydroxy-tetrahydrodipicolinate synthase [Clostridiales bacterium]|nr:4-hydroxy-tetrahydrodipicolinate synthase [Clostridiales bacterium]
MMKNTIFEGIATALVTPMHKDGSIDYESFARLVDWQIESGISALVVCGTTGEASTLTDDEHRDAIKFVVERTNGRVPVIAGTGSNDLAYAIDLTKHACDVGADAVLVVTPYYNKATQKGLIQMYTAIADASDKPVILYNVPSRTGVNIEPSTYAVLADHPNIVGIKEANGNISKILETFALVGDKLDIYSGNDDQIVPLLSLGGKGCISVISNILPKETSLIASKWFEGDVKGSAELQIKYHDLITALFSEVNPIPVKAATAHMGFGENVLRMPLTSMDENKEKVLLDLMRKEGIIQ